MATIEPAGLPAVRLQWLRSVRSRTALDDAEMVRIQRAALIDPAGPNPSVEALLHAFLPPTVVLHTHATAVLSLTDQPHAAELCADLYGSRFGLVPYVMPGFALARAASEIYEAGPEVDGLILLKHGVFTFGTTARQAYERMLAAVSLAEARLARARVGFVAGALPERVAAAGRRCAHHSGACSSPDPEHAGAYQRFILDFRASSAILEFVNGAEIARYAQAGVATPDHTLRTKSAADCRLAPSGQARGVRAAVRAATRAFVAGYQAYFARHATGLTPTKQMLDPLPRIVLVPGLGLFGLGATKGEAAVVADLAKSTVETIAGAESIGQFESISEHEMFEMEYWSLEQAKIARRAPKPLAGQIAVITGGAGAIGAATARAFQEVGAEIALLDVDAQRLRAVTTALGSTVLPIVCDVTDGGAVRSAIAQTTEHFGGIDLVVSNAGAAVQGEIGLVEEPVLRQSFELNFFAPARCPISGPHHATPRNRRRIAV